MPSAPDSSAGGTPTPRQSSSPESTARDTVPTAPLQHSTWPPSGNSPLPGASTAEGPESPAPFSPPSPTSDVRSSAADSESNTLHSASHPGSSNLPHWDERRILHLEHEFDQLSARSRLLSKRVEVLSERLRIALWLGAISLVAAVLIWVLRG